MKRNYTLCLFCAFAIFCTYTANAQDIKVRGRLTNEQGENVEAAAVILLRTSDDRLLEYGTSDSKGGFDIRLSRGTECKLVISHLSYRTITVNLPSRCDTLINLVFSREDHQLQEALAKGKRPPIQYEGGDWIVNAENFISPGMERTLEVLRQIPGIEINEQSRQISLFGKAVELKFNGVKMPNTFEILNALPPEQVNQLVLTIEKRAEHDGNPKNALIDIKTKKKFIDGFMGNLNAGYGRQTEKTLPGNANGSFFIMLMKKNFYLNLSLAGETSSYKDASYDSTWYASSQNHLIRKYKFQSKKNLQQSNNLNLSWNIKNGNRLNTNIYFSHSQRSPKTKGFQYNHRADTTRYTQYRHSKQNYPSVNIAYESSPEYPFSLKASYGYLNVGREEQYDYRYLYSDLSKNDYTYLYDLDGRQHILKADFWKIKVLPNKKRLFIGTGAYGNFARTKTKTHYIPADDNHQPEDFDYKEQIGSIYIKTSYELLKKMTLTIFLYADYTHYNLQLKKDNLSASNGYWNFLPEMNINTVIGKNWNSTIGFISTAHRPNYNLLSPKIVYTDENDYSVGNPQLKPEKEYDLEWWNMFYKRIILSCLFQYNKDKITSLLIDRGQQITEQSYQNAFDEWWVQFKFRGYVYLLSKKITVTPHVEWVIGGYRNCLENFSYYHKRQMRLDGNLSINYTSQNNRLSAEGSLRWYIWDKTAQSDINPLIGHISFNFNYKCLKNRPLYIKMATTIKNDWHTKYYFDNNIRYSKDMQRTSISIGISYNFRGGKDLKRNPVEYDANDNDRRYD